MTRPRGEIRAPAGGLDVKFDRERQGRREYMGLLHSS